jgi:hypothetical protein
MFAVCSKQTEVAIFSQFRFLFVEIWKHGDMEIRMHGGGDMETRRWETWTHENIDRETWRHGDIETLRH